MLTRRTWTFSGCGQGDFGGHRRSVPCPDHGARALRPRLDYFDPEPVLAQARGRDRETSRGPLHGLPSASRISSTPLISRRSMGHRSMPGHRPPRDAACVALLRRAGAVILGKTATTEFAGASPATTINPRAAGHTPGGSSSGSAAAVADFMVPAALGTQTLGSVIRPAAFCGIVGFKPSHGLVPVDGVKPSAPTLDTVGFLLRCAEDIPLLLAALAPGDGWKGALPASPRFVFLRGPQWDKARPETLDAIAYAREFVPSRRRYHHGM